MKRLTIAVIIAGAVLTTSVSMAGAATLLWKFEATLSASSTDVLNVNNERVVMNLLFDTQDVWSGNSEFLYFPTVSASASITGSHSISLNTAAPAALTHLVGQAGMVENVGSVSWVDFVIDGTQAPMINFVGIPSVFASHGDSLIAEHLISSIPSSAGIDLGLDGIQEYKFVDATISVAPVPLPPAAWLLLSAIGGLGFMGWLRQQVA